MDSNAFQLHLATMPAIDDILRDGARRALQAAIEREVEEYIERNSQQPHGVPGDGIQTGRVSSEPLAKTQRQHVAARRDCRNDLQRWRKNRRLSFRLHPRLLTIAPENVRQGFGDALPDHFALG